MKRLLFLLFFIILISSQTIAQTPAPPGDPIWQIDANTASEMMKRLNSCFPVIKPCRGKGTVSNTNTAQYDWLVANYNNVTPLDARYRREDVDRYMTARGLQNQPKKYKVAGFKTVIYRATTKALTGETVYFDFVTICPPPEDENGNCAEMSSKN